MDLRRVAAHAPVGSLAGRDPTGTVNHDIVSNLDFAETLLDAAGVAVPSEMQGRSMVPVLQGHTPADWRKGFYYHYYEHPGPHNVARQYGVITERYKLVYFYEPDTKYWELFDLSKDPMELKSVYDLPEYAAVQKELHQKLDALRAELKVPAEDPPESRIGGGKPGAKAKQRPGGKPGRKPQPAAQS